MYFINLEAIQEVRVSLTVDDLIIWISSCQIKSRSSDFAHWGNKFDLPAESPYICRRMYPLSTGRTGLKEMTKI